ncbi:hypothetical protein BC828DRAFT_417594 [Blastocladiella britannica]|nr:hypothetical protein BC828DRAFT_417594 [Blastocladiella britannica]
MTSAPPPSSYSPTRLFLEPSNDAHLVGMVADAAIAFAYVAIPCTLFYFARRLRLSLTSARYHMVVLLFISFITLCGITHFCHVLVHDEHLIMVFFKVLTAVVSVMTAIVMSHLIPSALQLPSRFSALEEELGLRIDGELLLRLENTNLQKLRAITQAVRQPLAHQRICEVACEQLAQNFSLRSALALSLDLNRSGLAMCIAAENGLGAPTAPRVPIPVGTQLKLGPYMITNLHASSFAASTATASTSDLPQLDERNCLSIVPRRLRAILGTQVPPDMFGTLIFLRKEPHRPDVCCSANAHEYTSELVHEQDLALLLLHSQDALIHDRAVLGDAVGQVEMALAQSMQFDRDAAHRAQVSILEREKREAEELSGVKTAFLATISHELRTPLNAIIGLVDLLLSQEALAPSIREILQVVSASSNLLLTLVNDILDFSKLEFHGTSFALDMAPISLTDVVEQTVALVYPSATNKGVIVTAILEHETDHVLGDKLRCRQIITNILSNAIKFTCGGWVTLTITSTPPSSLYVDGDPMCGRTLRRLDFTKQANLEEEEDPEGKPECVYFQVRDTGIGIVQDKLPLLFEKFQQLDSSITRRFQGTGLGLAIVSRLVELHHGSITVDSIPNVGSLFTITLTFPRITRPPSPTRSLVAERLVGVHVGVALFEGDAQRAVMALLHPYQCVRVELAHQTPTDLDVVLINGDVLVTLSVPQQMQLACSISPAPAVIIFQHSPDQDVQRALTDRFSTGACVLFLTQFVQKAELEAALRRALMQSSSASPGSDQVPSILSLLPSIEEPKPLPESPTLALPPATRARAVPQLRLEPTPALTFAPRPVKTIDDVRILLVDDNPVNLTVAHKTLALIGYTHIDEATNGLEAVAFVEAHPDVAVCLMDVSMPLMDGLDATRAILGNAARQGRGHLNGLPYISAMTASAFVEERTTCFAAGMHDFVAKPARRQDLEAVMSRYRVWRQGQLLMQDSLEE